ncbi:nuclease [Bradyrhizobium sp. CCBAU 051011]|uniref:thermonuclease family protein n=1 Tax=Bradyrhizobium sp. CCBAU 051011 TaxID=858422 RepID=UPI00137433FF|nr:thermonuclease family protein [Bradyrhizobium sp. CCBAU 051011]QHO72336.1 nuclease [Bradyrhizobium sp. CCBAU 051011]
MRSIAVALFVLFSTAFANAQEIAGQAVVTDGDTIEIRGIKIRLWGIDAVESKQLCWDAASNVRQCGRIAANAVAEMIGRRVVSCLPVSLDRDRRIVGRCSVNGHDLSEVIVRYGYAIDYVRYSNGAYAQSQELARSTKSGNWQYAWQYPENFRACMKIRGANIRSCSQQ